jgi:O-antigen ligase
MKATPLPVLLLIISFVCPTEFSIFISDLRLPPHRVALLFLVPIALFRLMSRPDIRTRPFDFLFIAFAVWTTWVYGQHMGGDGYVFGGSLALESLGGYLVARAWVRDEVTMLATLRTMLLAILFVFFLALPETLFGQIFVHDFLFSLTGYKHPTGIETRASFLTRAYGTFDHPIHLGTFCAAFFALFWYAERKTMKRTQRAVFLGGATMLGLSSAPLLCIVLQSAMLAWERLTRGVALRTPLTLTLIAGLYVGASLVSNRSPINLIATGMTFDSATGFYRLQIWEHGLNNVWANPFLGIGLGEWDRPMWMASSTVDAFWLVTAMRGGIPGFLILVIAVIALGRGAVVRGIKNSDPGVRRLATGWMMSLIALCLVACTVHFWNVLNAFFFFFLGLGGWLADPKKTSARASKSQSKPVQAAPAQQPAYSDAYGPYAASAANYGLIGPQGARLDAITAY